MKYFDTAKYEVWLRANQFSGEIPKEGSTNYNPITNMIYYVVLFGTIFSLKKNLYILIIF